MANHFQAPNAPTLGSESSDTANEARKKASNGPAAEKAPEGRATAEALLAFWFDPAKGEPFWFRRDAAFDETLRSRFGRATEEAAAGLLDAWAKDPEGALALLLLLDQLPRNLYRRDAKSYASDGRARALATRAVAKGWDRAVPLERQLFFYLPFEHAESLESQISAVALIEGLQQRGSVALGDRGRLYLDYAVRHRDAIARWGRFLGRDAALGRPQTEAERQHLVAHPEGF